MCFKEKILQASANKEIFYNNDKIMSPKKLMQSLAEDLGVDSLKKDKDGWIIFGDAKISIKNVSYLGFKKGETRSHKKRIQFSNKLIETFKKNNNDKIILGHYINEMNEKLYVKFTLNKNKVGKSKSSHVSVHDLQNGFKLGSYSKVDIKKNFIEVFKPEFLKEKLIISKIEHPFKNFAEHIKQNFGIWNYKKSYTEMKNKNFKNARQTMWAGWYLEFLASEFFFGQKNVIAPYLDKIKNWQPDAFYKVPVEMKFHKEDKYDIPGNDYEGVLEAIRKYERISLFVVNGKVVKETSGEVDKFRRELFNLEKYVEKPNHRKLKKTIEITEIGWCDIDIEKFKKLKIFNQGVQANGAERKPKLMYDARMLDFNFE